MKKIVLSVDFTGNRMKIKAMKAVSKLSGVESVSVDLDDKKLTVIGDVDPVWVVEKLRKKCDTEIISIGPAKEPEKKKKKEEEKKENPKKEEQKKNEAAASTSAPPLPPNWGDHWRYSEFYHSQMRHPYYYRSTVEEDPNSCVIC